MFVQDTNLGFFINLTFILGIFEGSSCPQPSSGTITSSDSLLKINAINRSYQNFKKNPRQLTFEEYISISKRRVR
jgi:hypothetical protein